MEIRILRREDQVDGQFNDGAILEKRPVVYQDKRTFPYSNLFYWAHAWTEKGSIIGLHPHQGFEIMSFVLKGSIEHYDTKNKKWIPLNEGSVQIIRSGKGISHAEKMNAGAGIFQIWFDPDLSKSLEEAATYDDYAPEAFAEEVKPGMKIKTYYGSNAPVEMITEGIMISQLKIDKGNQKIAVPSGKILSVFILEGIITVGNELLHAEDFFTAKNGDELNVAVLEDASLFIIESPLKPSYQTYIERN